MQTISYKTPKYDIKTRYSIEYLMESSTDGAQRWELYHHSEERGSSFEPWELLDTIEFDDVGVAWEFYLVRLLDPQTYVVNPIFEEIIINGETVREAYIEESPTFHWNLCGWVDREMRGELGRLRDDEKINAGMLSDYTEFMEKWNGERHFREFLNKKQEAWNA